MKTRTEILENIRSDSQARQPGYLTSDLLFAIVNLLLDIRDLLAKGLRLR